MSILHMDRTHDAADFYREVFGWATESFAPELTLFRLPGYVGGQPAQPVPRDVVAVMAEDDAVPGYWSVGFWVRRRCPGRPDRARSAAACSLRRPTPPACARRFWPDHRRRHVLGDDGAGRVMAQRRPCVDG